METLKAILTRYSVREYQPKPVPEPLVEQLLRAAMQAPSAHNRQPWHFVQIDDRGLLNAIADYHPYAKMLYRAPLAIAVCSDRDLEKKEGYRILDCAAATENILLAAHALGLGGVWIAVYPNQERMRKMAELFHLPNRVEVISMVAVGYPLNQKQTESRYRADRIHRNGW
ncbi:MAG TPA: nitroreductase family protein [Caldithrix abyssi]|uniref:Nitroreductase family protein n=1 Tax=Caldithrix abyssi TaxID=187145 RepID=A0A7V5PQ60_CALAY|nr:nitroreductase family protein [Caldithrix abyssi]